MKSSVMIKLESYPVSSASILDGFLNEVVGDDPGGLLVEDRVHQRDAGGAPAGFGFSRASLVKEKNEKQFTIWDLKKQFTC